jgi:hypothetical protein
MAMIGELFFNPLGIRCPQYFAIYAINVGSAILWQYLCGIMGYALTLEYFVLTPPALPAASADPMKIKSSFLISY